MQRQEGCRGVESQPEGHQVIPVVTTCARAPQLRRSWEGILDGERTCKGEDEENGECKRSEDNCQVPTASI